MQVTVHHEDLLVQAAGVTDLEGSLTSVRGGLKGLDGSLDKFVYFRYIFHAACSTIHRLRAKIRTPYQTLYTHVTRLERLQQASDILRRTSRFVVLTRRLQTQLAEMDRATDVTPSASDNISASKSSDLANSEGGRRSTESLSTIAGTGSVLNEDDDKERVIAKAALSIAELGELMDVLPAQCPLSAISITLVSLLESHPASGDTPQHTDVLAPVPLSSVKVVSTYLPYVDAARERVASDMEQMVINGLRTLVRLLTSLPLQV